MNILYLGLRRSVYFPASSFLDLDFGNRSIKSGECVDSSSKKGGGTKKSTLKPTQRIFFGAWPWNGCRGRILTEWIRDTQHILSWPKLATILWQWCAPSPFPPPPPSQLSHFRKIGRKTFRPIRAAAGCRQPQPARDPARRVFNFFNPDIWP